MSEWKTYKLGDLGEVITGKTPSRKNPEDWGNEMLFITPSDYKNYGKRAFDSERRLSIKGIERLSKKILPPNSILVTCIGSDMGKVIVNGDKAITNQQINSIIPNSKVDNDFLYYRLVDLYEILRMYGRDGTAVPIVNKGDFESIETDIPPLPQQKAIASVLSSLDDKIDLLHRQNQTLEAMAGTLFRQWFQPSLKLRSAGVEEAEEDWEEVSLYNAIDLVGGGTPKTSIDEYWDGDTNWLSGGDIASNHKNFVTSTEKSISQVGLQNSSARLLPRYSTVISARGTVGKYCLLSEEMAFSQSNYGIKPKFNECYFFTYLLIAHSVERLKSAAYGSVFDTITTKTFKNHMVQIPSKDDILTFEKEISSYFQKMLSNQQQIEILEKLRDTLLPKLMSGQVRVRTEKSAEKYV